MEEESDDFSFVTARSGFSHADEASSPDLLRSRGRRASHGEASLARRRARRAANPGPSAASLVPLPHHAPPLLVSFPAPSPTPTPPSALVPPVPRSIRMRDMSSGTELSSYLVRMKAAAPPTAPPLIPISSIHNGHIRGDSGLGLVFEVGNAIKQGGLGQRSPRFRRLVATNIENAIANELRVHLSHCWATGDGPCDPLYAITF